MTDLEMFEYLMNKAGQEVLSPKWYNGPGIFREICQKTEEGTCMWGFNFDNKGNITSTEVTEIPRYPTFTSAVEFCKNLESDELLEFLRDVL
jgi:hypothetical protein